MRKDFEIITDLVPEFAKLLDIGCGDGSLLAHLRKEKKVIGRGMEIDPQNVTSAIAKGVAVMQGDANVDLNNYPDDAVDVAILSQTLQVTKNPRDILKEIMRISKYAIISVPNFGYVENRLYLLLNGRMPVTKSLSYEWYDTPNIHFCTLKDFEILAKEIGFRIEKKVFINDSAFLPSKISASFFANLFAKQGIYLLSRPARIHKNSGMKARDFIKFSGAVAVSAQNSAKTS